jgi:hypothetical protein
MIAWQRDLQTASTPSEVVQLARGFIAAMPREAFALLPPDCRPAFIASGDDVRAWSKLLNETYWARRSSGGDLGAIQDIWSFFLRASIQLTRIEEERIAS